MQLFCMLNLLSMVLIREEPDTLTVKYHISLMHQETDIVITRCCT